MRTGLLLLPSRPTPALVELGVRAEALGYDDLWVADERFFREAYTVLGLIAARTRRIRLGPGVTDPYSRHPALTAMAVATLDVYRSADKSRKFDPTGTPLAFVFRRILEECTTVDEAEQLLKSEHATTWMNLVVCDRDDAAVFEITPDRVGSSGHPTSVGTVARIGIVRPLRAKDQGIEKVPSGWRRALTTGRHVRRIGSSHSRTTPLREPRPMSAGAGTRRPVKVTS